MNAKELTELAISWLSATHPDSILVTELSVADWGGASIDVAAITPTHIVGVEIKGEGDSPTRLDRQGLAYGMVAREMWLLCDESIRSKCFARKPSGWGRLEIWEDAVRPWNRSTKLGEWVSTGPNSGYVPTVRDDSTYEPDVARVAGHLCPRILCETLWRDELYEIARHHKLKMTTRATVEPLREVICEQLPVSLIHTAMITALRNREWKKRIIDLRSSVGKERTMPQQSMELLESGAPAD